MGLLVDIFAEIKSEKQVNDINMSKKSLMN